MYNSAIVGRRTFLALTVSLFALASDLPTRAQTAVPAPRPPLRVTPVKPVRFEKRGAVYFADFGADAYGNLQITLPRAATEAAAGTVRLGEKLDASGAIDRKPPGSVNFREIPLSLVVGQRMVKLEIPTKPRHNEKAAVHTPPEIGEITPFRYVEIECPVSLDAGSVRQLFVHTAFDDTASAFHSSDATLNQVWDLCKHTMKATTAFGVYIDGERERIPYEADAYLNYLSHLACDANPSVARVTTEHLLAHPTWPTEWSLHMPLMAALDYEATGDPVLAIRNYDALRKKLLMDKARPSDGLLQASAIVDWPAKERDGYNDGQSDPNQKQQVGPQINTVANAFYYRALKKMAVLARAISKPDDARVLDSKADQVSASFNSVFFDKTRGVYVDGEGSAHASLHANMFALAFDLVPAQNKKGVADFVESRGMACSVYGAQYLLEALYESGKDETALRLMTSHEKRGWWHMIELGSTMTLEAWDAEYKPNLTWNHAWGAVPANIISRYLVGVRPLTPGYTKVLIAPRPGSLQSFDAKVPTVRGPIGVLYENKNGLRVEVTVPKGVTATVSLPFSPKAQAKPPVVTMNKKKVDATPKPGGLHIENVPPGRHVFTLN